LLAVDFDGIGTDELAVELNDGQPLADTVTWTSGREGRHQRLYCVPIDYWGELQGHHEWKLDNGSKLELRYNGHQSVLPPSQHPETGRYQWLTPPAEFEAWDKLTYTKIPYTPQWMIDALLIDRRQPEQISSSNPESDHAWAIEYMAAITANYPSDDYTDWFRVGIALKSIGDDLFPLWDTWSAKSDKYDGGKIQRRWDGFKPRQNGIKVLAWFAKKAGWQPAIKSAPDPRAERNGKAPTPKPKTTAEAEMFDDLPAESVGAKTAQNSKKGRKSKRWLMLQMLPIQAELTTLKFNLLTEMIEIESKPQDDRALRDLRIKIEERHDGDQSLEPHQDFADVLHYLARANSYHPIHDYLRAVEAVYQDRNSPTIFDELLTRGLGCAENPLYSELLKRALVGAIRRVFNPGCKHDWALVFQGKQGSGKSTFWRIMAGDAWFTDSVTDVKNKDELMKLLGYWIVELAELERITNKKEDGDVKGFLSRQVDLFRAPYSSTMKAYPRACVVVGTVNQINFLKDPTGARRYGIIPAVNQVDTAWLQANRDLLWASAMVLYRKDYPSYLSAELEALSEENNKSFQNDDPWADGILEWVAKRPEFSVEDILRDHLLIDQDKWTRRDQMAIAAVLKQAGFKKEKKMIMGTRSWRWFQPDIKEVSNLSNLSNGGVQPLNPYPASDCPTCPTFSLPLQKKEEVDGVQNGKVGGEEKKNLESKKLGWTVGQVGQLNLEPSNGNGFGSVQPLIKVSNLKIGDRYKVTSVDAVGICADIDSDMGVRIHFELSDPRVLKGVIPITAWFEVKDLQEITP
jgi:predicted P-loop ATPase